MEDDCPWDDEDKFDDLERLYERVDIEEARLLQQESEPAPESSNTAAVQRPDSAEMIARAALAEPPVFPRWDDVVEAFARASLLARLVQTSASGDAPDLSGLHRCDAAESRLILSLAASAPVSLIVVESRFAAEWFNEVLAGWLHREDDTVEGALAELHEELFGSWQHGDGDDDF